MALLLPHQQPRAQVFATGEGPSRWLAVMLRPLPPLDDAVAWLWYVEGLCPCRARLPPIGGVELVIDLADSYDLTGVSVPGAHRRFKTAWLEGLRDSWLDSEACGATSLIGARFTPTGAFRIIGPSVGELGNQLRDVADALGSEILRLRDRIGNQIDLGQRLDIFERYLRDKWSARREVDQRAVWAAATLADGQHANDVRRISRALGMSHQRLVQLFHEHVGLTPKRFARIARFGRVVRSLIGAAEVDWPQLALEHGYFDQSHLVREFQLMAGCAPTEFLSRRDGLSQSVMIQD